MAVNTIGILGAGKLGVTLSRLALAAGYKIYIAGSGKPEKIALSTEVLSPGAVAATSQEVASRSDVVVLALPLSKYQQLPKDTLAGKLVIDAMNYWWEVDGDRDEITPANTTSSRAVQMFLNQSRVVKAFNHMGYHDLADEAKPKAEPGRKAIAVAGDDQTDVEVVMGLVDRLGFDPLYVGTLDQTAKLEAGGPAFGANLPLEVLKDLLA